MVEVSVSRPRAPFRRPADSGTVPVMLAQVLSWSVLGVDAIAVRVEVDLAAGLPSITVVGLAESAVREGKDRVMAALANAGFAVPPKRITINLAPAGFPAERKPEG